jgi:NAD(P)-dependent dehydrogenase (short-subunit alcohol dehydrogenase family)
MLWLWILTIIKLLYNLIPLTLIFKKGVVDEIKKSGGNAIYVRADVSEAKDAENMFTQAEKTFGKVNILFNNAGISHAKDDDAVSTEESVWDLTMKINVKGVFLGCKYGIPAIKRAGGGSIINTASFVAILGAATPQIAYTASKGAVLCNYNYNHIFYLFLCSNDT